MTWRPDVPHVDEERQTASVDRRGAVLITAAMGMTALALMSIAFVPFFLFASVYAQVSLGKSSSSAGECLPLAT